jgi:hypothetical protein
MNKEKLLLPLILAALLALTAALHFSPLPERALAFLTHQTAPAENIVSPEIFNFTAKGLPSLTDVVHTGNYNDIYKARSDTWSVDALDFSVESESLPNAVEAYLRVYVTPDISCDDESYPLSNQRKDYSSGVYSLLWDIGSGSSIGNVKLEFVNSLTGEWRFSSDPDDPWLYYKKALTPGETLECSIINFLRIYSHNLDFMDLGDKSKNYTIGLFVDVEGVQAAGGPSLAGWPEDITGCYKNGEWPDRN